MASEETAPELLVLQSQENQNGETDLDNQERIIQRCDAQQLSYNEFYWRFMHANWPVIITNVSNSWECRHWVIPATTTTTADVEQNANNNNNNSNNINFDYLKNQIGNVNVPVADCNEMYYNSHAKLELKFHEFLERWQCSIDEKATNCNLLKDNDNLYLKDWHLAAQMPNYKFYQVPKYFASDWLNEQLIEQQRDDYRFVYMGPTDSWTSFHSDVFGSYSWSTNIIGHKKWLIMPPGEELKLADNLSNLPFSIDERMLNENNVRYFTINQLANEAIFVPSGWYHQVWNVTDTISVNHNWFNACNVRQVWNNLHNNLTAVRKEIADCEQMEDFHMHCQTMLRASFGINYLDFIELLEDIAARRLTAIKDQQSTETAATINSNNNNNNNNSNRLLLFNKYQMNSYHIDYDIECIQQLLKQMLKETIPEEFNKRCEQLQKQLEEPIL